MKWCYLIERVNKSWKRSGISLNIIMSVYGREGHYSVIWDKSVYEVYCPDGTREQL